MKVGYIWYSANERAAVEEQFHEQRPEWDLTCIPEDTACSLNAILRLLRHEYDALLVHLSLRFCLALKMAEVTHREDLPTKIILFSRTVSDRAAVSRVFDGRIHPDRDMFGLTSRIEAIVGSVRVRIADEKEMDELIVRIFNSSDTLKAAYLAKFQMRHKHDFVLEDYQKAISASAKPDWNQPSTSQKTVFISYSTADGAIASELADILGAADVPSFMAERNLEGGDVWEERVRDALARADEVILILTPNSIRSSWVLIDAAAAWSLGKRITPCVVFVNPGELPAPISKQQARPISTEQDKRRLVEEIRARLLPPAGREP